MSITYLPGKEPHPRETRRILKNINREGWNTSIDCYLADGGYEELKKALGMEPAEQHEARLSGLQLRRIRTRHLQGPLHRPPGPPPAH